MKSWKPTVGAGRSRVRESGIQIGVLPTGRLNAITDVEGVRVGHTTLIKGKGTLNPGHGPVRTGVTVILPHGGNLHREKVPAAVHTINGHGKVMGFEEVRELGVIEAPIALTNTFNVGLVADALLQYAIRQDIHLGIHPDYSTLNVVVGETNDSFLNDLCGRHVKAEHVWNAIEAALAGSASCLVQEGAVGAGTGTSCFGWKGGIGSASRQVELGCTRFTTGALVQSNFGKPADLIVAGIPIGRYLQPRGQAYEGRGSIMIVLATDAPLSCRQLRRLCVRASTGLARTGAQLDHGSGDFVIAFSTAYRNRTTDRSLITNRPVLTNEGQAMTSLFSAVIESVEEAILNSLFQAEAIVGRDNHVREAFPIDLIPDVWAQWAADFPVANSGSKSQGFLQKEIDCDSRTAA